MSNSWELICIIPRISLLSFYNNFCILKENKFIPYSNVFMFFQRWRLKLNFYFIFVFKLLLLYFILFLIVVIYLVISLSQFIWVLALKVIFNFIYKFINILFRNDNMSF